MRSLIVEDNELARDMLSFFLAEHAEIETADDGRQAVERFRRGLAEQNPFNLVLLDIVMPEMDGQEALRLMRQAEKDNGVEPDHKSVIIMTTALHSQENMVDALWDGDCNDYLVKPVTRADLTAILRRYRLI
jgi:two-component system, chemotaxis family, chemotaxis protein CheY